LVFFGVLTLMVGQREERPACKKLLQQYRKILPWGSSLNEILYGSVGRLNKKLETSCGARHKKPRPLLTPSE